MSTYTRQRQLMDNSVFLYKNSKDCDMKKLSQCKQKKFSHNIWFAKLPMHSLFSMMFFAFIFCQKVRYNWLKVPKKRLLAKYSHFYKYLKLALHFRNTPPFLHTLIALAQYIKSLFKAHFLERVHVKAYLSSNGVLLMEEMEKVG